MKEQLQEALLAVKAGEEEQARVLLAELLREEPDNIPAWILLSKLATSDVQKAAFLRKVLALDPDHAYAQQELSRMGAISPPQAQAAQEVAGREQVPPAGTATAVGEVEAPQQAGEEPAETAPPPDLATEPQGASQEEEEPPWAEEGEIVTAEPLDDSLDWFLPEAEEEEAIESSLEALNREGEVSTDEVSADEATAGEAAAEDLTGQDLSEDVRDYDATDYAAQEESGTLPTWVPEDEVAAQQPDAADAPSRDGRPLDEADLPDWLQDEPDPDWLGPEEDGVDVGRGQAAQLAEERRAAETEARLAAAMAAGREKAGSQTPGKAAETSPWLLGALALIAALVFLLAFYAAYTFFF